MPARGIFIKKEFVQARFYNYRIKPERFNIFFAIEKVNPESV